MPYSSNNLIVSFDVSHAGAVQPLGFFPVNLVRTSMDLVRTSRCCCSLRLPTCSCVYPWSPLQFNLSTIIIIPLMREKTYISWPASLIFASCSGKDSSEWAGTNQVVLILNLSQSFNNRSTPTVAPYIPRDTSVGLAGVPDLVLILIDLESARILKYEIQ